MLARHAEDLYWAGRYLERAEDTARMLDVTYHGLLESPAAEGPAAWQELLEVLFLGDAFAADEVTESGVIDLLVLDPANPGSIVASVARARENARGVRDRISTELWEAVNMFHLELAGTDLPKALAARPYEVYRMIKTRCQTISGVASATMSRDGGYRFFMLGQLLERAEMTCRMLAVRYARLGSTAAGLAYHQWVVVLKSVSAYEAYLREHRAAMDSTKVLEFLLLSRTLPRSVLFCLLGTERHLRSLLAAPQRVDAERLLGMVRARLEFCDVPAVVASGLDGFLQDIQSEIWKVAGAVDAFFFKAGSDLEIHEYETT